MSKMKGIEPRESITVYISKTHVRDLRNLGEYKNDVLDQILWDNKGRISNMSPEEILERRETEIDHLADIKAKEIIARLLKELSKMVK